MFKYRPDNLLPKPLRLGIPSAIPKRSFGATTLACCLLISNLCIASEPVRVWVDASGQFTIEARLEAIENGTVILVRPNGSRVRIAEDQLGFSDHDYLEQWRSRPPVSENTLRFAAPELPEMPLLPKWTYPKATTQLEDGQPLAAKAEASSHVDRAGNQSRQGAIPGSIPADPQADPISVGFGNVTIGPLHAYDHCSPPMPIITDANAFVAVSVSTGVTVSPDEANRVIRFDPKSGESRIVWKSKRTLTLLDHHRPSKQTLVLTGHSNRGSGGQLAVVRGWDEESISIQLQRSLPPKDDDDARNSFRPTQVYWAKWLDDEHIIAAINSKLAVWNIVSGELRHLICSIDSQSVPAISAGRHYVAVPDAGGVCLYRTQDGKFLGRLPIESNRYAQVAFSPHGDSLAITTTNRLRVWELSTASIRGEVASRRSLGKSKPVWIDNDLVLSSSGVLLSLFRGVPVWRYELVGTEVGPVGKQTIGFLTRRPTGEIIVTQIPHAAATAAMAEVDRRLTPAIVANWRVPGRSRWVDGQWADELENE
ncbi:SHD1 domain-containing protein [Novipirellula aureliae]|nr:SHD1 domain-containing protein [Novipirellula aureliae]